MFNIYCFSNIILCAYSVCEIHIICVRYICSLFFIKFCSYAIRIFFLFVSNKFESSPDERAKYPSLNRIICSSLSNSLIFSNSNQKSFHWLAPSSLINVQFLNIVELVLVQNIAEILCSLGVKQQPINQCINKSNTKMHLLYQELQEGLMLLNLLFSVYCYVVDCLSLCDVGF